MVSSLRGKLGFICNQLLVTAAEAARHTVTKQSPCQGLTALISPALILDDGCRCKRCRQRRPVRGGRTPAVVQAARASRQPDERAAPHRPYRLSTKNIYPAADRRREARRMPRE